MTSINRLKNSRASSRIIILVTDGNNNMGEIDPLTSSEIARSYDIKIYAIGVGSLDGAIYEVDDPFLGKREIKYKQDAINESVLKEIAHNTGGGYFRAQDAKSFVDIMKQIDKLEKDEIEVVRFTKYRELYKCFFDSVFYFSIDCNRFRKHLFEKTSLAVE
jgi:Ca-activated chloride channel family protein